jgi:hypothetical protein
MQTIVPAPSWRRNFIFWSGGLAVALVVVGVMSWQSRETFMALICAGMALESTVSVWRLFRIGIFHDGGTLIARRWLRRNIRIRLADLVEVHAITTQVGDAQVVALSLSTAERTWVLDALGDAPGSDEATVRQAAVEIERLARYAGARIRESAAA